MTTERFKLIILNMDSTKQTKSTLKKAAVVIATIVLTSTMYFGLVTNNVETLKGGYTTIRRVK